MSVEEGWSLRQQVSERAKPSLGPWRVGRREEKKREGGREGVAHTPVYEVETGGHGVLHVLESLLVDRLNAVAVIEAHLGVVRVLDLGVCQAVADPDALAKGGREGRRKRRVREMRCQKA